MSTSEPVKKWRTAVPQLGSTDWETREAAYDHARHWLGRGHHALIRHWEGGVWREVERLQPGPAAEPDDGALFPAPAQTPQGGQHP